MIKAFIQGWITAIRSRRIGLIIYGFQFLLALILGMLVYDSLGAAAGNSLELKKLLYDYDHTVIQDIANVHGDFLGAMQAALPWLILTWLIFSAFISGGILFSIVKRIRTWDIFWAGGAKFFKPFLQIGIFFLLLIAVSSALIWFPLASDWQAMVPKFPSEREYIFLLLGVFALYVLLMLFIFGWATASKLFFIKKEEMTVWQSLKNGFSWTLKNIGKVESLLLLFAGFQLLVVGIYWLAEDASGMISPTLIFVFFIIQQLLVLFRIFWRIAVYRGVEFLMNQTIVAVE